MASARRVIVRSVNIRCCNRIARISISGARLITIRSWTASIAVIEWFKGSALRPFLAKLNDEEQAAFLERYRTVLLPFPHIFIVATR